ncbi:MAG TPA: hypothetical protein VNA14_03125 [Mycobacteriales bacterium]|nr:hypothetical protein [Mycobacteriales bacterium]
MTSFLAHPLTDPGGLGVPPYAVALAAVVLVAAVAVLVPIPPVAGEPSPGEGFADVDRPLGTGRRVTRALTLLGLLALVYAGRRGSGDGLSNITPPLVVGVAWAALVVASLVVRRLWTWLDPWDGAARGIEPLAGGPPAAESDAGPPGEDPSSDSTSVWPAVAAASAVVWFLVARADSTQPRAIGAALASYTIVAVAIGVALGRQRLAHADVLGLSARWAGELRDGLAVRWSVPSGAEAVLGVVAGGLLLDVARRAGAYADVLDLVVSPATAATPRTLAVSLLLVCAVAVGVLHVAERAGERRGVAGTVAPAVLPVVLALVVVWRLRRLLVSLQLLPITASDPLGRGWDLFGTRTGIVDPNPFGTAAQRWTSIVLVTSAGVVGAVALRRRVADRAAREPASYALYLLVGLAVLGLAVAV